MGGPWLLASVIVATPRLSSGHAADPSTRAPEATEPGRAAAPGRRRRVAAARRIVVLGDLMLDVVLAPARPLEVGTDVPGRVALVQGGSAATTARWLGRLGARST